MWECQHCRSARWTAPRKPPERSTPTSANRRTPPFFAKEGSFPVYSVEGRGQLPSFRKSPRGQKRATSESDERGCYTRVADRTRANMRRDNSGERSVRPRLRKLS